ncbi:inppl1a, partial [Symbiodinium microadriaticum]
MVPYSPKQVSIFVSSFNQGEGTIEELTEDIPGWLLEGHDMYVIGLQECLCLEDFRAAMHAHLGGEQAFTMHTCEIGSNNTRLGFHGFIALTVFVRTEDIRNGFIKMTESSANDLASGTDLIVTTAANKGAVGLPFQIHDTSIGFVTAHLPSDSKGKSKLPKRNAAAQSMLREVVLASEDVGGDMQYLHDHLVVLGDLNYRMNPPGGSTGAGSGQTALSSIAIASA